MIEILILLSEQEQDTFSFTTLAAALLCIRDAGARACSVRLRQFAVRHQIARPTSSTIQGFCGGLHPSLQGPSAGVVKVSLRGGLPALERGWEEGVYSSGLKAIEGGKSL